MSEKHASGHVKNHQIRTLVFGGTVIFPFYLFLCEKLDLISNELKSTIKFLIHI